MTFNCVLPGDGRKVQIMSKEKNMKFEEFTALVAEKIKTRLLEEDDEAVIRIDKVLKNNDVELTAVNIRSENDKLCPTIYLEPFFREEESGRDVDDIVSDIIRISRDSGNELTIEAVTDETDIMDKIIIRLVNRDKNRVTLSKVPYIEYNDLAVTFRRVISLDEEGVASTIVTHQDINRWKVDVYSLYKIALKNTEKMFPPMCQKLEDMLEDRYGFVFDEGEELRTDDVYILSNSSMINGATVMLYDGMLASCANMVGDDIYILPSSVHEVLFISAHAAIEEEFMRDMVSHANSTVVSPMDYLSDSVYRYSVGKDCVSIV